MLFIKNIFAKRNGRKPLDSTDDKIDVFVNDDSAYSEKEIAELNDEEKLRLFEDSGFIEFFMQLTRRAGTEIVNLVSDNNVKLQILSNYNIADNIDIVAVCEKSEDSFKLQLLCNQELAQKYEIVFYTAYKIILSMDTKFIVEVLANTDLVENKLELSESYISGLIAKLTDDDEKNKFIETYKISKSHKSDVIATYSTENKIKRILNSTDLRAEDVVNILSTVDVETLINFLRENKEFWQKKKIIPCKIIKKLDAKKQKEFVVNLENINLTTNEKRQILAALNPQVKQDIDTSNFPKEYKSALSMQTDYINFKRNLEDYRGFDELMEASPEDFTPKEKSKFLKLCEICPNMSVKNREHVCTPTEVSTEFRYSIASEYKEAEEWIDSVISSLKPEYSKAQKVAIIDNAIGKKLSYSPDFDTEVNNANDCRSLWKIVASGYGVCIGIATLEKYMLDRAGIESQVICSENHAFLKLIDIELPLANGETVRGNTILDPTWNLTEHRFGAKPYDFCISYEQARQHDIDSEGKEHNCHKNDAALQDATVSLDAQSLRQLFASVGLADKEGNFPIKHLIERAEQIDKDYASDPEQNINNKFSLLKEVCPEFATCQNSSMSIVRWNLLDSPNLNFDKCVVNRVYDKADKDKRPVMYVYITSEELGRKFYVASKEEGAFVELTEAEFVEQFECYEYDLEKSNGIRPWESKEQEKEYINLATSSGKEVASESEEKEI